MNLGMKKSIDLYLGTLLLILLKIPVVTLGKLLGRDHDPKPQGAICIMKMLGGGSLVLAYRAILSLKLSYPERELVLLCTQSVAPFAKELAVFDKVIVVDDRSASSLIISTLRALFCLRRVDTILDFEVHSRLSTVLSVFTMARNRFGFYRESVFWRKNFYTHMSFFNLFSGSFHFYEALASLCGATILRNDDQLRQTYLRGRARHMREAAMRRQICLAPCCSDLGRERMLNTEQWLEAFTIEQEGAGRVEKVTLIGGASDHEFCEKLKSALASRFPDIEVANTCGTLSLHQSIELILAATELWTIDSGPLHFARLAGVPTLSFWGPTAPSTRIETFRYSRDRIYYHALPCSPCIHNTECPPCGGRNICIESALKAHGNNALRQSA